MDFLTLSQLNLLLGDAIKHAFPETYWLMAETSDVRVNASGHCYLEFIEKSSQQGNNIIARGRAYIWNNMFRMLNPYFEQKTGQAFASGLKVLVRVSVEFHPLYGYGLNVCDIDPAYTLGDQQLQRQETIRRLKEDGILTLNRELDLTKIPQRIAIITSHTAAGYEDFYKHMQCNRYGFVFYQKLFPAVMQGEQTVDSIIRALEQVYAHSDQFDVVVIIRGGGSTSDLSAFDSYLLASHCAQFPLPIFTGIGHDRDETVLDLVAYHHAKTPTAVADYLIERLSIENEALLDLQVAIRSWSLGLLSGEEKSINSLAISLRNCALSALGIQQTSIHLVQLKLGNSGLRFLEINRNKLNEKESFFKLSSPDYILSKGYSMTMKAGQILKSMENLRTGDEIETILAKGKFRSRITSN